MFLVFLLACYGVTNIITSGKIFSGVRSVACRLPGVLGKTVGCWIRCAMCVGVPVGVLWSLLGLRVTNDLPLLTDMAVAGSVSSGWCWILKVILAHLGEDAL